MSKKEILSAFVQAKKEILQTGVFKKDKAGYGYKYLDLVSLLDVIEPVLSSNGLILYFSSDKEGFFSATLAHAASDESLVFGYGLLPKETSGKSASQNLGSAISYARRYLVQNIFNIVGEEDTDGLAPHQITEARKTHKAIPNSCESNCQKEKTEPKITSQTITLSDIKIGKRDFKTPKGVEKTMLTLSTKEGQSESVWLNSLSSKGEHKSDKALKLTAISWLLQSRSACNFTICAPLSFDLDLNQEKKNYLLSKKKDNTLFIEEPSVSHIPF